jgi:hypothetical protein
MGTHAASSHAIKPPCEVLILAGDPTPWLHEGHVPAEVSGGLWRVSRGLLDRH